MPTRIPIFEDSEIVALKARALSWIGDGLATPTALQAGAGNILADVIRSTTSGKAIVVDCKGLYLIGDHALSHVCTALNETGARLYLVNAADCGEKISSSLSGLKKHIDSHYREDDFYIFSSKKIINHLEPQELENRISASVSHSLEHYVKESFCEFDNGSNRLQSTPLRAEGVYNARLICSEPSQFVSVTIALAEEVESMFEDAKPTKAHRLLSVSLRASPFAAAIGSLLSVPVEIVDHMGPRMKILEEYTLPSSIVSAPYIYVGDFAVGGSELKIAETYAIVRGANLSHSVVIGSVLPPERYGTNTEMRSLVSLRDLRPGDKYEL